LNRATVRPLFKPGHPRDFEKWPLNIIEVGRLTEVQYKLIGMAVNMILLRVCSKMLLKVNTYKDINTKLIGTKTSSAFPALA